jgi:hypothetical protein
MAIAADYPLLDIVWTMLVFFGWVIWLVLLVRIIGDIFRSDKSGLGKAGWILFVVILPFLGVLVYVIANGDRMNERDVRSVAPGGGPAAEIARAKDLLDSGAITQAEFDALKTKALT